MTVADLTPYIEYAENGVTLNFAAAFRYGPASNLEVSRLLTDGTVTVLTMGVDWTAPDGPTDAGGTVTLSASVAGAVLRIQRVTARSQATDYITNDNFPAATHEDALDKLTQIAQEQDVAMTKINGRALMVPEGETIGNLPGWQARRGNMLGFTSDTGAPLMVPESIDAAVLRAELASGTGAGLVRYLMGETDAVASTVQGKLRERVSIFDFLTPGEQTAVLKRTLLNDLTGAFTNAVREVNQDGGGQLRLPDGKYNANILLKAGVQIVGNPAFRYLASDPAGGVEICAVAGGWVIDTPNDAAQANGIAVVGVALKGLGAGTACGGLRIRNLAWANVLNCYANNFADQGFKLESNSIACNLDRLLTTNVLLNRVRAQKDGAIDIDGTDHYLFRLQANPSLNVAVPAVSDANLRVCALAVRGAEHWAVASHGEYADVGIYWAANKSRVEAGRADRNRGHGWEVAGGGNRIEGHAIENGLATANTYDDYLVTGANNRFTIDGETLVNGQTRYGVNDQSAAGDANKNYYDSQCFFYGTYGTRKWFAANNNGPSRIAPSGYPRSMAANSTTPNLEGYETWLTVNTVQTDYTDFQGCLSGEYRTIYCFDNFSKLIHNGGLLVTRTGQSRQLIFGEIVRLQRVGSVWREQGSIKVETGWTADTGTAKKTTTATYVPGALLTYSAGYVQAEHTAAATRIQSIENALRDATQEIKAIKDVMLAAGMVSA